MYTWIKDEEITAAKLNAMQHRPNMDAVNRSGLGFGGLDDSALSDCVINADGGTWGISIPRRVTITEHELGNLHYEYNHENEEYSIKTGAAGVTGKVQKDAGTIGWFNGSGIDLTCKNYIWEKINTDYWGNPTKIERCVSPCSGLDTQMWDPSTYTLGTVWRRIGTIEKDSRFCDAGTNATWAYNAVNENNAFALPVARRWGWDSGSNTLVVANTEDINARYPQSKWAATVLNDNGLTVPVQGVGELGGVKIYNTFCGNTNEDNRMGIGIAAGIEFYDPTSYNLYYNCICTRPKPTSACIPFGPEGKYGHIRIDAINPFSPWQFMLSGELDIGSWDPGSRGWDPGSHWLDCIPLADGPICGTRSFYGWEGRFSQPPGLADMKHGLIDGSVTRLTNQDILWCGAFNSWCATFRPGEINCGGIGIGTAQFEWTSNFYKDTPLDGTVAANRNGGLITGIANDSPCRYSIDQHGFIHAPNPDWMGKHGVNIPCANNPLFHDNLGQDYLWGNNRDEIQSLKLDWGASLHPSACCYHWGLVNGKVMSSETYDDASISWWAPDTKVELTAKLGDVKEGTIRIPAAKFSARIAAGHAWDWDPTTVCSHWGAKFGPGGGIIRGVKADIWYLCHVCTSSGVEEHHYMPYSLPFIDTWGVLHLPQLNFTASPCCGTYLLKPWTGRKGIPIYNKGIGWDPQLPPSGTGGINPGSGGYVPIPRT